MLLILLYFHGEYSGDWTKNYYYVWKFCLCFREHKNEVVREWEYVCLILAMKTCHDSGWHNFFEQMRNGATDEGVESSYFCSKH